MDSTRRSRRTVAVELPGNKRNTRVVDLDRQGGDDVLVYLPAVTGPHRVITLIAR